MPMFSTPAQVYMLPSGFYVLGEIARAEKLGDVSPFFYPMSDSDMDSILSVCQTVADGTLYGIFDSGRYLVATDDPADTTIAKLEAFVDKVATLSLPGNFVDATWSAGASIVNVSTFAGDPFLETDREGVEWAVQKAMQLTGFYYDIASVTRVADKIYVTLDESNKPYDAGFDGVWALVADWYGGELP